MRFYWGLGVGHVYSHEDTETGDEGEGTREESDDEEEGEASKNEGGDKIQLTLATAEADEDEHTAAEGNPDVIAELGLEDRENDAWDSGNSDGGLDPDDTGDNSGEEELELEYTYQNVG